MQLKTSRIFTILLSLALVLTLGTATLNAQQLYYHNFGATTITTHPYVAAPVTIHANFSNSNWTNSKNAWTSGVGAPPGQGIQVSTSTGTTNIYLKFTVTPNYQATITSFNFWRIRSNSGPQDWKLLVNGTEVGSGSVPTAGSAVGQTALATPVTVGGNVTVELVLTNATGGWFRLDDFTLNGTVALTCNSISVSSFSPATGPAGTKVKITGSGFTGASDVKFNGISAPNYTVISNTEIEAIIPPGGTTGKVDVFDALGCNGSSAVNYQVLTSLCSTPQAPVPDLFISEVYDQKSGSGGMIELYNPTSATITFNGQYRLLRYGDIGDTTPTAGYNLVLPGSIGPKSTYLLYGTAPLQSICATPSSSVQFGNGFNGNDKFELLKGGNVIDVAHITSTAAGFTTRRKPTAIAPKNVFNSADWDIIVHGSDPDPSYCDDLGVFNLPVPPNVTPIPVRTICAGSNTTFTATLSNTAGYTYQWKTLNSSGAWVNVTNGGNFSGATTATLTVSSAVIALNDTQYYCEMTSLNCNVKSSASQLYVIDIIPPVLSQTAPTCTVATGSITVNPVTGATYSKDNNAFQSSNVFNSLSPGTYTITIKVGTCTASNTITINPTPTGPSAPTAQEVPATCTTPGGISVDPVAGMEYSIGTSSGYQTSNTFSNVPAGTYNVTVKNSAGCISAVTQVTVNPAPSAPAAPTAQEVPATCTTPAGITIDPVAGMEYSIGTSSGYQTSNTFNNVPAGTYNVTVKNSAGCISAVTQVTVNPAPSAPAAPTAQEVPATCTTPAGISVDPVAGMEYSIGTSSGYQASNTFSNVPAGTYNVTVKNSAGCISAVTQVTVNPAPTAPQITSITEAHPTCLTSFGKITVIATGTGLEYSIQSLRPFQSSNEFSNVPPGNYQITVRNAAGCEDFGNSVINPVPAAPSQPVAIPTQATCTVTSAKITVTPVAGSGIMYQLNGGTPQASNEFTNVPAGTYIVTVINAEGCDNVSDPVTINPIPAAPARPVATQIPATCSTSASITVTPVAGMEYSIGSGYQTSNIFNNVPAGTYNVTVRNTAGCISPALQIVVAPAPTAPARPVATQTPATCSTAAIITVTPVAGMQYSIGSGYQSSNIFNNVPARTYNVTVRNTAGCISPALEIVVAPAPTAPARPVATQTPATCSTSASITVTPVAGMEYSIGSGYQTSNIFNNVPAGTYNVTVRNTAGCISTALQIIVAPAPTAPARPVATQTPATCSTPASITVTPVAGMEYSIGSGYHASNVFNNIPAGTYNVTVRNTAGCISPAFQIIVAPAPTSPARPVATQTPATCSTSAIITVTPVAGMEYSIGSGHQTSNIFNNVPAGTYNVTVRNTAGCISPALQIVVAPAPTQPVAAPITGNSNICDGNTLQLTITTTGGTWKSNDSAIATINQNGTVTALNAGIVTITYEIPGPCPATSSKTITVHPKPKSGLLPRYYLCTDNAGRAIPVFLYSGINEPGYVFVWRKENTTLTANTSSIVATDPGIYSVTATNTLTGCSVTASTMVGISSIASATASVGFEFENYQTIRVNVTGGSGDYEYSLDGEEWQDEPYFIGHFEGDYTVRIKDKNGCGTAKVEVVALNYPRFFTPNGDGVNDTWNIKGVFWQNTKIYIYDRYGKLITEVRPGVLGWDGTYNGHRLPATDYWFTMKYKSRSGDEKELKAHFALKR